MVRFFAGVAVTVLLLAVAGGAAVKFGWVPARADVPPPKIERMAAKMSLDATIRREAPQPPYPYGPPTDATLAAGAKLYVQHCADCHGSAKSEETTMAKGLYIAPPQFAKHGVDDDPPGTNYWKIEHGIRFTAMPAYGRTLTEEQIWQLAFFVSHPSAKLPAQAAAIWNAVPAEADH